LKKSYPTPTPGGGVTPYSARKNAPLAPHSPDLSKREYQSRMSHTAMNSLGITRPKSAQFEITSKPFHRISQS